MSPRLLITLLVASNIVYTPLHASDKPSLTVGQIERCDAAIRASKALIRAQDATIARLKASQQALLDKAAQTASQPLLPAWAWAVVGASAGLSLGILLSK